MSRQTVHTLQELLAADDARAHAATQPRAFGDAFLYAETRMHRLVRDAALAGGVRFTRDHADRYLCHSLLLLPEIVRTRTVPVVDTRWAVEHLDAARPGFMTSVQLEMVPPHANFLTHECAHILADDRFQPYFGEERLSPAPARVLRALIAESFANVVESVLFFDTVGTPLTTSFVNLNIYYRACGAPVIAVYRELSARLPAASLAGYLMLAHLVGNFGYFEPTEYHHQTALALLSLKTDAATDTLLRMVLRFGADTNKRFVVTTNRLYFNALGIDGALFQITNFCPLEACQQSPELLGILAELWEFLGQGAPAVGAVSRAG